MRWAALDFETATRSPQSACSIGVVLGDGPKIIGRRDWLIRPPHNRYDAGNIAVHGIYPHDTQDVRSFPVLWQSIGHHFKDLILVAHNASFDIKVLRNSLSESQAKVLDNRYLCTVVLSRAMWPGLKSYSLPRVCEYLNIEFTNHHDALADSVACAQIMIRILAETGTDDLLVAADQLGIAPGQIGWDSCRKKQVKSKALPLANKDADPFHPLYRSEIVFTGKPASGTVANLTKRAADLGAMCKASVGRNTDYLVVGDHTIAKIQGLEDFSSKMKEAYLMANNGHKIMILTETEFLAML